MLLILILWIFEVAKETVFALHVGARLLVRVNLGVLRVGAFVAQIAVL